VSRNPQKSKKQNQEEKNVEKKQPEILPWREETGKKPKKENKNTAVLGRNVGGSKRGKGGVKKWTETSARFPVVASDDGNA